MDHNQLAGQGQGYLHPQYGHHQDDYQHHQLNQQQFEPHVSYDNYQQQSTQHGQQYSPEYSGKR